MSCKMLISENDANSSDGLWHQTVLHFLWSSYLYVCYGLSLVGQIASDFFASIS